MSIEGTVEFKSLPSGLHNVDEDLVYFSHDEYAGISAFKKGGAVSQADRNATYVAVGALVRLNDGRLGKAWEHAAELKHLAEQIVVNPDDHLQLLVDYWQEFSLSSAGARGETSVGGRRGSGYFVGPSPPTQLSPFSIAQRKSQRTFSAVTMAAGDKGTLLAHHPVMSVLQYIDFFGPLIFPMHRLALLRKRILLVTHAPIRSACEYGE